MTTFDDWLRALKSAGKGPVDLPAAMRGLRWQEILSLPGDLTGAVLEGAVRIEPDAADTLAEFIIAGPDVSNGTSTWVVSLNAGDGPDSTGILPVDGDADGVVQLPFAIKLTPSGGNRELLFGGTFTLLGDV